MEYALIVIFACNWGCGTPTQFTAAQQYITYEECETAGKSWLSSAANQDQAIGGFRCVTANQAAGMEGIFPTRGPKGHTNFHIRRVFD
jgi:hypothetical protein